MRGPVKSADSSDTLIDLNELIRFIDSTPAVLWGGKGGAKELLIKKYLEPTQE